jgi:hypothetical protein
MLSNFAFIKETFNLVFPIFASIEQNYSYKNLWLTTKKVWGMWWDTCHALYFNKESFASDVLIINGISYCRNMFDFGE